MRLVLVASLLLIVAASCTVTAPPPESVVSQPVSWTDPCGKATKANLTPDCFQPNPEAERRVGTPCPLHPAYRLMPDTVAMAYGFVTPEIAGEKPGLFINSRLAVGGGCVVGKPFTEVAYCPECRRVRAEWERSHGGAATR